MSPATDVHASCRQCWQNDATMIPDRICDECRPRHDARVRLGDEYRTLHALWLACDHLFEATSPESFVARLEDVRSAYQEAGCELPYDRYHQREETDDDARSAH